MQSPLLPADLLEYEPVYLTVLPQEGIIASRHHRLFPVEVALGTIQ